MSYFPKNRIFCVNLSDHNPNAVKFLIDFFYFMDYKFLYSIPTWEFEIKKDLTNSEFFAAAITEFDNIIAEREDPWEKLFVTRKGKKQKKKGKLIVMDEPAGPLTEDPYSEPISFTESLFDKTFFFTHCRVYVLAKYLQIDEFKNLAARKFRAEAEKHWNHPDFFEAMQKVYRTSVRSDKFLRDIVVNVMKKRQKLLNWFEYQDIINQFNLVLKFFIAVKINGWG